MLMNTRENFWIIDERRVPDLKSSSLYQDMPRWFGGVTEGMSASWNRHLRNLNFVTDTVRQTDYVNIS
jgi:hypothetical protein